MAASGVTLDVSSNRALAASLAAVVEAAPQSAALVRALATRAMSEAQYFSTGVPSASSFPFRSVFLVFLSSCHLLAAVSIVDW